MALVRRATLVGRRCSEVARALWRAARRIHVEAVHQTPCEHTKLHATVGGGLRVGERQPWPALSMPLSLTHTVMYATTWNRRSLRRLARGRARQARVGAAAGAAPTSLTRKCDRAEFGGRIDRFWCGVIPYEHFA